jgi:hypothetical protein
VGNLKLLGVRKPLQAEMPFQQDVTTEVPAPFLFAEWVSFVSAYLEGKALLNILKLEYTLLFFFEKKGSIFIYVSYTYPTSSTFQRQSFMCGLTDWMSGPRTIPHPHKICTCGSADVAVKH